MLDPFFRAAAHRELDDLVAPSAIIGIDGAIVLSPSHTIELAAGEMSGHAAHIAQTNTHKASERLVDASFPCDSGHWVFLKAIDGGWVLAVQTAHIDRHRLPLLMLRVNRAVAKLRPWVIGVPFPLLGPGSSGSSGAPAQVTLAVPRRRLN